jgi:hypothetical protein
MRRNWFGLVWILETMIVWLVGWLVLYTLFLTPGVPDSLSVFFCAEIHAFTTPLQGLLSIHPVRPSNTLSSTPYPFLTHSSRPNTLPTPPFLLASTSHPGP